MLINRRIVLKTAVASAAAVLNSLPLRAAPETFALRSIPSTGETLPVVGLGSWITFNVGDDQLLLDECAAVIDAFFAGGGKLIDSSPMYGSSQSTIGYGLKKHRHRDDVFSADKVWTSYPDAGPEQISRTRGEWGVKRFDLMQVHNLLEWKSHLETLRAMKARGELRYIGVTTSHGRRHDILERIMNTEEIDFVQVTYNILDREVEKRILPLARERGIGVIINRPYQRGFSSRGLLRKNCPSGCRRRALRAGRSSC